MRWLAVMVMVMVGGGMGGCETHVVLEQPKPMQINVNLSGQVDIVIHDARENLREINGAPTQVVSPADIGLPAKAPASSPGPQAQAGESRVLYLSAGGGEAQVMAAGASQEELKKAMAARSAPLQNLWTGPGHLVGEAHTGMVEPRGKMTAEQQALVDAENKDRATLYATEAKQRSMSVADVALGYYVARLGYVKAGAWYEKFNQTTNAWEWKEWGK